MNKIHFAISLLFCFTVSALNAQISTSTSPTLVTAKQYEAKALEAFENKNFNVALEYYQIVLTDEPQRIDLLWNTAESARATHHYFAADKYYELLAKSDSAKNYANLSFRQAMVKKSIGNYDGAIVLLQKYAAAAPIASSGAGAGTTSAEIQSEIEACEWAKTIVDAPAAYEVVHLNDNVNSIYTDIAPVQYGNTLYYTSAYFADNAKPVTHIFSTDDVKGKSTALAFNSTVAGEYTAQFALNTEGSRVYYNICKQTETGDYHCEIFTREKGLDGTWKEAVRLADTINTKNYTSTQPNVGFDKVTGKEMLYFVSDRPGGKGGLDVWAAELDSKGNAGIPKNLSDVNTAKDDITPFYYNDAQILFFSSEGYKSLGGFDVYHVNKTEAGWSTPTNVGYPMNTSFDEMYYSMANGRSYFTSNRKGGKCDSPDHDCLCNDIYQYDIKVDLKAETFFAATTNGLNGCKVDLIDVATGNVLKFDLNELGNNFAFPLDLNKKYLLVASKANHRSDTVAFNTMGLWQTTTLYKPLRLQPNLKLNVYVFDAIEKTPLSSSRVEMRDAATGKLLASEILTGNVFTYNNIEFGKSYWLYGYKDAYTTDSSLLVIDAYGTSKRYEYSDSLYLAPFRGLPLTLYFDNDHPNPRTQDTVTYLTYGETYRAYVSKQAEYLKQFYKDNANVSASSGNEISEFFTNKITANYNKLLQFSEIMAKYLASGNRTLEIVIEGYASPLAKSDYNRRLSGRRISSLINQLYEYNNGILRPYIQNKNLRIRVVPFGSAKSAPDVSDDTNDRRNSVYSVKAMQERKVEIREINALGVNTGLSSTGINEPSLYWDYDSYSLALGAKATEIGAKSRSITSKGIGTSINGGVSEYSVVTKGGLNGKMSSAKQRIELVLVDAYTGEVIKKGGSVDLFSNDKKISRAKQKGSNYQYSMSAIDGYVVKGNALGYSEGSSSFYGNYTEGGAVLRDTMYLTPFNGLPLTLYFNNDRPDANSKKLETVTSYDKSFKDYYGQRKNFTKNYTQYLAANGSVPSVINEMDEFFTNDVKGGFDKLIGTANVLESYLKRGYGLEIIVEGYASPLANTDYNEYLTTRRIKSVTNYLSNYGSGSLRKFISSGLLKINVRPLGESNASSNVSDDSSNPKLSIYSLDASRERKVVIKDVIIKKN